MADPEVETSSFGDGQIFHEIRRAAGDQKASPHPLRDITTLELEEVRQMKHPPLVVARVMETVHLILNGELPSLSSNELDWSDVLRTVVRGDFLKRARSVKIEDLKEKARLIDYVCRQYFAGDEALTPQRVRRASRAVVAFFGWTVAIVAGILPLFPLEVGGSEARLRILEVRDQQRRESQIEEEKRQKRAEEAAQREAERREVLKQKEAERQEEERRLEILEKERLEAAACEEERLRMAVLEEEEAECQRQEDLRQQVELRQIAKQKARLRRKEAKWRRRLRLYGADSDESSSEAEQQRRSWNSSNPDHRVLSFEGAMVRFVTDEFVDYCNVVTMRPVRFGRHLFEVVVHHVGDHLWIGVTTDEVQAGAQVAGWNLRAWSYYTGRRGLGQSGLQPGLHVDGQARADFQHVVDGDTIGLLIDADRWAVAYLRNREFQGACALSGGRGPLFILAHLDAADDLVELRKIPLEEAPSEAVEALDAFVPPSWGASLSDCSTDTSTASGGSDVGECESALEFGMAAEQYAEAEQTEKSPSFLIRAAEKKRLKESEAVAKKLAKEAKKEAREARREAREARRRAEEAELLRREAEEARLEEERKRREADEEWRREVEDKMRLAAQVEERVRAAAASEERVKSSASQSTPPDDGNPQTCLKEHLRQLKECFDEGLLTEEEFRQEKSLLLQSMRPTGVTGGSSSSTSPSGHPKTSTQSPPPSTWNTFYTEGLQPLQPSAATFHPPSSSTLVSATTFTPTRFSNSSSQEMRSALGPRATVPAPPPSNWNTFYAQDLSPMTFRTTTDHAAAASVTRFLHSSTSPSRRQPIFTTTTSTSPSRKSPDLHRSISPLPPAARSTSRSRLAGRSISPSEQLQLLSSSVSPSTNHEQAIPSPAPGGFSAILQHCAENYTDELDAKDLEF
eukprot:TRINITY_DN27305_c0_g1_i1.p1 TRINITY_DN27305_c0_g1~~TRINITY_DN27305_c0_g1_i1.p1  ORF type:complete len:913 (-),score=211.69 TRINITY_DN27305_c0_g1_i1:175-2913(-)